METIEAQLEQHGIRPTAMRLLIYKFLAKQENTVTLTDIEKVLTSADRTTLYRTMKTFDEHGIVHQIDDGTGITKYALCEEGCLCDVNKDDLHLHFHCTNCNETVCLTDYKIPQISLPSDYKANDVNLVVKGICEKCSGN